METKDYLSKEITHGLKGYLCLCILVHHLYQFSGFFSHSYFGHFLNRLGAWTVAVFFFISGYGLFSSYRKKGKDYLKTFFSKRFLPLYFTYLFFVLIYLIVFKESVTLKVILTSIIYGGTIVSFGWFFQSILFLYIIFYLSLRFTKGWWSVLIYALLTALFVIISLLMGQRYLVFIPFTFGILVSLYRKFVDRVMERFHIVLTLASFAVFFSIYMIYVQSLIMGKFTINNHLWNACCSLSEIAVVVFTICICFFTTRYSIPVFVNPVVRWLADCSLEIYACQGIVLYFAFNMLGATWSFVAVSFICDIIIAFPVHKLLMLPKKIKR